MKFLHEFRKVRILGESNRTKELLAPSGEFHPGSFDALPQSRIEVLSHTTKVRKGFDMRKFNKLSINVLRAILGLLGGTGAPSLGGPDERFSSASARPAEGHKRLVFCSIKIIFEKSYSGMVKASRHPRFIVRTGAPE